MITADGSCLAAGVKTRLLWIGQVWYVVQALDRLTATRFVVFIYISTGLTSKIRAGNMSVNPNSEPAAL